MKLTNLKRSGLAALMLMSGTTTLFAQQSPAEKATGKIGSATVTISYSSPSVRGRKIWGGLVPYNEPWRAGANKATVFETDKPLTVEGKALPAGKYTLFATPGEKEWTIILNSETGQWGIKHSGEANFDPAKNVLSVTVKPVKSATMNEKLAYVITGSGFSLNWENLSIPVAVK